jgi:hypothetical protein
MNLLRAWRAALRAACALALASLGVTSAQAHSASTAYLTVTSTPAGHVELQWRVALRDIDVLLDLDADSDGRLRWREVLDRASDIEALAQTQLRISAGAQQCRARFAAPQFVRVGELGFVQLDGSFACAGATNLHYGLFDGVDPTHRLLVRIDDGAPQLLAPGGRLVLERSAERKTPDFGDFVREGVGHILGGFDHLLFLVALLLPAVVRRSEGRWVARTDRRAALVQVAWVATAFTLAHSLTLACATFGWWRIAPAVIEPLVAATVLAAALNNLWPVVQHRLAVVAFGFGLVHGFAFAEVLAPLELPRPALAQALAGFNLGVELGQLLVVAVAFGVLALAARWRGYPRWVLRGGSVAVAVLAVTWIVERLSGVALLGA